jgi:hypothetical protein
MAKRKPANPEILPLPKSGIGSLEYFLTAIQESEDRLKPELQRWKNDLASYNGRKPNLPGFNNEEVVNVNVGFYTAENKQPNLFYTTPFIQAESVNAAQRAQEALVQAVINQELGHRFIDAEALMDSVCKDVLVTAGLSPTKIGYECVSVMTRVPSGRQIPQIDPMTGQPAIDPMSRQPIMTPALDPKTGEPETIEKADIIYAKRYWKHFSPSLLRIPRGFTSSNYDEATWLGMLFPLSGRLLKEHGISQSSVPTLTPDMMLMDEKDAAEYEDAPMGIEIWYKAYLFDENEPNPDRIRQLVIAPGRGKGNARGVVLVHRNSPWQEFTPHGAFVRGMKGFPIHVATIRTRPESAYPKSDAAVLSDVALEKCMGRTIMVAQRKRNLPMTAIDKSRATKETVEQLEKGNVQSIILTDGPVNDIMKALERSNLPAENFEFDRIAQIDIDRLSASGANQQSLASQAADTATEATIQQRAADNRVSKERERLLEWYLKGVDKVWAIVQLTATDNELVKIVGEDGLEEWKAWSKRDVEGQYLFSLKPDSSERTNAAEERELFLRLFNLIANAPGVNTLELIRMVVKKFNVLPRNVVADKLPESPGNVKPSLSISINPSIDLMPDNPAYPIVLALMKAAGVDLPQAPSPITSPEGVPPVNQHDADLTGQRTGPPVMA